MKSLQESIGKQRKAKDVDELKSSFRDAKKLYEDAKGDKKLQAKLISLVGGSARGSKDEELHKAVLMVLSDLGDPRGAKYVKPYLRQPNKAKASALLDLAVAVAADVPDPSLVEPLLGIVLKSKHLGIVYDAVRTLGKYGGVKRKRVKILETLIRTTKKSKPGGRPRMRGSKETLDGGTGAGGGSGTPWGREAGPGARWNTLSSSVPKALSELTGLKQEHIADWFTLAKDHKGKLGSLFSKS